MLTISQLASYAGVTVRAVRHYHHVGLMPEPARDGSGYRTYGAADVVRLIRIRTLAEAGVPLARVQELLDATPAEFSEAVTQIDAELRARIRELQEHRRRIARLADGDSLALPPEVVEYLDRLRANGVSQAMVEGERDGWILMAARWPEKIPEFMVDKNAQLEDPRTVQLYRLIDELVEGGVDEDRLSAVADLLAEMLAGVGRARRAGPTGRRNGRRRVHRASSTRTPPTPTPWWSASRSCWPNVAGRAGAAWSEQLITREIRLKTTESARADTAHSRLQNEVLAPCRVRPVCKAASGLVRTQSPEESGSPGRHATPH